MSKLAAIMPFSKMRHAIVSPLFFSLLLHLFLLFFFFYVLPLLLAAMDGEISEEYPEMANEYEDEAAARGGGHPAPEPHQRPHLSKPDKGTRFLVVLLQALVMATALFLFFLFAGIAAIVLLHLFVAGRSLRRRRRRLGGAGASGTGTGAGLSHEELRRLPGCRYSAEGWAGSEDCAVCLEGIRVGERCRMLPACGHGFHKACVDKWLVRTPACPVIWGRDLNLCLKAKIWVDDLNQIGIYTCGGCFLPPKPIAIHQGPSTPSLSTWLPRTVPRLRKDHLKGPHKAITPNEASPSSLAACFRTGTLILLRWITMDITEQQVRPLSWVTCSVTSSRDFRAALHVLTAVPKPSRTTPPTIKRRVNCLVAQRASQRVTPPVMHAFQGTLPGTIW
ncbi:hypothetical protein Taro_031258 [Colocasia esculenta]|uniref:RING-type domain-containing protein n=1 Tax=Colocasia esculenta TaxID=4460 RepID=A0A843VPL2_COLES|nr:hypothetical protein [Colocasia esculenta]